MTALLTEAEIRVLLTEAHERVDELSAERLGLEDELRDLIQGMNFDEAAAVEIQTRSAVIVFDVAVWRQRVAYLESRESAAVDGMGLAAVGS